MTSDQNPVQLPCPFCGSIFCEAKYLGGQWQEPSAFESGWRVECCDCGALTRAFPTEDEAVTAWNTRAGLPKFRKQYIYIPVSIPTQK